ncbi:hypothetical protein FRC03_012881 [Tulasnella sp. 419]|nr:hypothetical protein FRC03_012881 [Tulasnella sp. 419]
MLQPRIRTLLCALFIFSTHSFAAPWNCKAEIGKEHWDFTGLNGEKTATRTRSSPPTTYEEEVRFNLCDVLGPREGRDKGDQCPEETLACLTETNKKQIEPPDRITAVIPLASSSTLNVQYKTLSGGKGLTLTLHGPSWPAEGSPSTPQSIRFTLYCPSSSGKSEGEPSITGYSSQTGILEMDWVVGAACPTVANNDGDKKDDKGGNKDGDKDNGSDKSTGSGIGWFFFLLLLAFVAYFGLGAYYNYNNYGATGWDLVPHRDFWRDVPYLLQDLLSHLFSSFRSGGSRSGYVSV